MASKLLRDAVTGSDENGWDFACPVTDGSCGDAGVGFTSTGWPTRKVAEARGQEHFYDHSEQVPMSALEDFHAKHNLFIVQEGPDKGKVFTADMLPRTDKESDK
jgi:hypothetical protein